MSRHKVWIVIKKKKKKDPFWRSYFYVQIVNLCTVCSGIALTPLVLGFNLNLLWGRGLGFKSWRHNRNPWKIRWIQTLSMKKVHKRMIGHEARIVLCNNSSLIFSWSLTSYSFWKSINLSYPSWISITWQYVRE